MHPVSPRRWEELTTEEAGQLPANAVAVLPFASIEQHGPHLPLNTDLLIAQAIVEAALARLPAALPAVSLPAVPFGHSPEHGGFPGTLTAAAETLLALGRDNQRLTLAVSEVADSDGRPTGGVAAFAVDEASCGRGWACWSRCRHCGAPMACRPGWWTRARPPGASMAVPWKPP